MQMLFILFLGFKLLVIQQPINSPAYVSQLEGTVTQFQLSESYAFLAHNYASGRLFSKLAVDDEIEFDNIKFHVVEIKQYQAINPDDVKSDFIDLETGKKLSVGELFNEIYSIPDRLILQTCIEKDGIDSWGRLFIIAEK